MRQLLCPRSFSPDGEREPFRISYAIPSAEMLRCHFLPQGRGQEAARRGNLPPVAVVRSSPAHRGRGRRLPKLRVPSTSGRKEEP